MKVTRFVTVLLASVLVGTASVAAAPVVTFAEEATSGTTGSNIQNDVDLTLSGDAIAVQKLKLGKTMTDGTTLQKIIYLKAGTVLQLAGPYSDLGGYAVSSDALPKINTAKYAYILNDEGLTQDGSALQHQNPATDISKDEPTFSKYSKKWAKKLTTSQVSAINGYSKNYGDMNNWLRGLDKKASKGTKTEIKRIDAAMKRFKNPRATMVWRGLSTEGFEAGLTGELKVGATYKDKGYMSATFDQEIAKKYATGVILQISLPKGKSTGAYIGNISSWKIEKEFLIKHGSTFKVTQIDDLGNGNQIVSLTYIK
jgi:hypothetical protein